MELKTPPERILYLLRKSGLSATELANRLPVSVSTTSRYLTGETTHVDKKKRELFAKIMGYDLHWIETGKPDPAQKEDEFTIDQLLKEERSRYGIEDIPDTERGRALQDVLDEAVSVVLKLRRLVEIERRGSED